MSSRNSSAFPLFNKRKPLSLWYLLLKLSTENLKSLSGQLFLADMNPISGAE